MTELREWLSRLNAVEDEGRFERALLMLGSLSAAYAQRPDVLRRKAILLSELGRFAEAIETLSHAGQDPKTAQTTQQVVDRQIAFYEELGLHSDAARARQQLLRVAPDNVRAIINQGISYAMADDYGQAIACFDHAIKLAPNDARAHYNKGSALLDVGRVGEALACLEETIRLDRAHGNAWYLKAVALLQQSESVSMPWSKSSKIQEARQCLGKALRADPGIREARQLLESLQGR